MLQIDNLHVKVDNQEILRGLDLHVKAGEVHAIMGPNGSGKSTLASVISGREGYEVTAGSVRFLGKDLLQMEPEERACAGLFLAFQYPVEIPGVNNLYFLKASLNAVRKARGEDEMDAMDFWDFVNERLKSVKMDESFLKRPVNQGFSGGEKNAMRSCSYRYWSRCSRCSTKPIPVSISMP
jgi:Fe-S cluster assembly ATP-binding protein